MALYDWPIAIWLKCKWIRSTLGTLTTGSWRPFRPTLAKKSCASKRLAWPLRHRRRGSRIAKAVNRPPLGCVRPAWSFAPIPVDWANRGQSNGKPLANIVPLSLFAPEQVTQSGPLGASFGWQLDRSAAGGELLAGIASLSVGFWRSCGQYDGLQAAGIGPMSFKATSASTTVSADMAARSRRSISTKYMVRPSFKAVPF